MLSKLSLIPLVRNYSIYPLKDSELEPQAEFPKSSLKKSTKTTGYWHTLAATRAAQE